MTHKKTKSINELINLLQNIEDKNMPVIFEGCDYCVIWNGKFSIKGQDYYGYRNFLLLESNYNYENKRKYI